MIASAIRIALTDIEYIEGLVGLPLADMLTDSLKMLSECIYHVLCAPQQGTAFTILQSSIFFTNCPLTVMRVPTFILCSAFLPAKEKVVVPQGLLHFLQKQTETGFRNKLRFSLITSAARKLLLSLFSVHNVSNLCQALPN